MKRTFFLKIKLRYEKSHRPFLLDEELDKLRTLPLVRNSRMQCHRDMYLFSANAAGIRISDLLLMRWRNIDGSHLSFRIKKTQDDILIKLPDESLILLKTYYQLAVKGNPQHTVNKNAFIFPLLKLAPEELDRAKVHNAISNATNYTNKDLRKLSELAGLDKKITFHTARHSWAIRALKKGMCIEYVSKLPGHASVKQTEVYAKIMNEELDIAMKIFNNKK